MPAKHPGVCCTLLDDGQTRCSASVRPGRQSCTKHAPAYDASYKRYKDAESAAKDLRAAAQTRRGDVHTLPPGDVGPRIGSVRAYIEALEREVRLRNEHDERFIGDPDEGHLKRLDTLDKQLTHHRDILDALRARLQRLKPAGEPTPHKHRRRHRHTVSDPTPTPQSPAQPVPSSRASRRRSHGQPNQRRGGHGKSHSFQIQGRKGHLEESMVEGDDEPSSLSKLSTTSFRVSEDPRHVEGTSRRGPEAESSGGNVAERDEDEDHQETSSAVFSAKYENDTPVTSDNPVVRRPTMGTSNTSPPLPSLTEPDPDGSRREPPMDEDDTSSQEHPENGDTSARRLVPPYPLPRIVGEYPAATPDYEETSDGVEPGWKCLKYAFTAILPATIIVLACNFATRRNHTSRI